MSSDDSVAGEATMPEQQYHNYTSNDIPWYVRLMWLGFWVLAIVYTIRYLFPALQSELIVK